MKNVVNGFFATQNLYLAKSSVDYYEVSKDSNPEIINSLREIIEEGYKLI